MISNEISLHHEKSNPIQGRHSYNHALVQYIYSISYINCGT